MPRRKPVFKIIFSTVAIILLILAALIYIPLTEKLNYDMTGYIIQPNGLIIDTTGTFIHADGTTESVSFAIDGNIKDSPNDTDELNVNITLSDEFRYAMGRSYPHYISMNQKNNDFPDLMICPTYIYDKQLNSSKFSVFALDLETKCSIVLFGSAPDCYLVASEDSTKNYDQLLEHFADFIESYGPQIWKE